MATIGRRAAVVELPGRVDCTAPPPGGAAHLLPGRPTQASVGDAQSGLGTSPGTEVRVLRPADCRSVFDQF